MTFKTTIFIALLFISCSATAQIEKGVKFIGGSIGLSHTYDKSSGGGMLFEDEHFMTNINPRAGIYLSKKWAVGFGLNLGRQISNSINTNSGAIIRNRSREYTIGAFGFSRYNHFIGSKFALFVDGSIAYNHGIYRSQTNNLPSFSGAFNSNEIKLSFIPGIMVFACPRLSLEASYGRVGYGYIIVKPDNPAMNIKSTSSVTELNLTGSTLSLGCSYYFPNRPKHTAGDETDPEDQ